LVWFLKNGLVKNKEEFMNLTLPQIILFKYYFYYEQKHQAEPKKYTGGDAQNAFNKFISGIK
jgi:hypothetical protein